MWQAGKQDYVGQGAPVTLGDAELAPSSTLRCSDLPLSPPAGGIANLNLLLGEPSSNGGGCEGLPLSYFPKCERVT